MARQLQKPFTAVEAWGSFGRGQSAPARAIAFLGQLLGICELEESDGWPQCSQGVLLGGHRLSIGVRT